MPRPVIGVVGPGDTASAADCDTAERLGAMIAGQEWVTLTGGRAVGVMDAALRGAKRAGGLTVGVLPGRSPDDASESADLRVVTGLGEGRNLVNVLTSEVLLVCGMSAGTVSEVALAIKTGRPTVLVGAAPETTRYWTALGGAIVHTAATPEEAIEIARRLLASRRP